MHLFSIKFPIIRKKDDLLHILIKKLKEEPHQIQNGDIIVISEKVIATSQGRVVHLEDVKDISKKAMDMAKKYDMDKRIVQLILEESSMILGGLPHVILAKVNDFLIANAGIDQSNAGKDNVVLLPANINQVVWDYYRRIREKFDLENLGIIFADSRVQPLRKGTIGIAIATAGFEPIEDLRGRPDLYRRPLEITMRAVADDLASAAQFLLSEADQQTPVVIIRDANVDFTENPTLDPKMSPEECLYMNIFSQYLLKQEKDKI